MNVNMEIENNPMGVYAITNKVNGKVYIGSSNNMRKRKMEHKRKLFKNCHENEYLQNSFNKYGLDNFVFRIVETVQEEEEIRLREQFYLDFTKCYERGKGYNMSKSALGGGVCGERNYFYGKGYLQKGEMNQFYGKSHSDETKKALSNHAKKRVGKLNSNFGNKYGNNPISKSVIQIDVETKEVVKRWESQTKAYHSMGYTIIGGGISNACKEFQRGILVQTLGYYWCYTDDYKNINKTKIKPRNKEKAVVKLKVKTNELLATYESAQLASREENISRHGISRTARGLNNHAGGYKWMYLEDYEVKI